MTSKHQSPEYHRNARVVRSRVKAAHKFGQPVECWRCRGPIYPGQPFDVGHRHGALGHSLAELAPEHRHRTANCVGNRSAGGKQGADILAARRTTTTRADVTTWRV